VYHLFYISHSGHLAAEIGQAFPQAVSPLFYTRTYISFCNQTCVNKNTKQINNAALAYAMLVYISNIPKKHHVSQQKNTKFGGLVKD